jgi:hypothetical protein
MRFPAFSRASLMGALLAVFLLGTITATATAKDGRDFAGVYGFTDVKEQGDTVQLTLHLRLFNNSEADIKGAVIVLMEGPTGLSLRGNFPTVKVWRRNKDVKLSQQFTVPMREYQDWLRPPAQPNVVIIYQDAHGQTWQKGAQMRPQPVI